MDPEDVCPADTGKNSSRTGAESPNSQANTRQPGPDIPRGGRVRGPSDVVFIFETAWFLYLPLDGQTHLREER